MKAAGARPARIVPERERIAHLRRIGSAVLALLVGLVWLQVPLTERVQSAWFDMHQSLAPRPVRELPVTMKSEGAAALFTGGAPGVSRRIAASRA